MKPYATLLGMLHVVRLPEGIAAGQVERVLADDRVTGVLRACQPMTEAEWMGEGLLARRRPRSPAMDCAAMTLKTLRWMRKCAAEIAKLSPDEQACRPFRIRAPEMLEVLDLAIAQALA